MAKDLEKLVKSSSIIKQVSEKASMDGGRLERIPLSKIVENPENANIFNIREEDIEKVAESIDRRGFDEASAVGVYDKGLGQYEVYSGHIRYRAQKLRHEQGKKNSDTLPCSIKPYPDTDEEIMDDLISSNIDGRELTPMEKARCVVAWEQSQLKDFNGNINQELARRFKMGRTTVKRLKNLLRLIPALQEKVDSERVMYSALSSAASLSEKEQGLLNAKIDQFVDKNGADNLSKALVESYIKAIKAKDEPKPKKKKGKLKKFPKACSTFLGSFKLKEEYDDTEKQLIKTYLEEIKGEIEEKLKTL